MTEGYPPPWPVSTSFPVGVETPSVADISLSEVVGTPPVGIPVSTPFPVGVETPPVVDVSLSEVVGTVSVGVDGSSYSSTSNAPS